MALNERKFHPEDYVNQGSRERIKYVVRLEFGGRWSVTRVNPIGQGWGIAQYDTEHAAMSAAQHLNKLSDNEVH